MLATGGFEWNEDLKRSFIRGPLTRTAAVPTNTGDGLVMAMREGAALGNMREWTITELLTSRALFIEGRAMRHCVATYVEGCLRRQTSIWSMKVENQRGRHRVLTIEIDLPKRTVCQVRGKCNRLPQAPEREIVEKWAAQEGLTVAESAFRLF